MKNILLALMLVVGTAFMGSAQVREPAPPSPDIVTADILSVSDHLIDLQSAEKGLLTLGNVVTSEAIKPYSGFYFTEESVPRYYIDHDWETNKEINVYEDAKKYIIRLEVDNEQEVNKVLQQFNKNIMSISVDVENYKRIVPYQRE